MSVGAVSSAPQEIHRHHGMHRAEKTKSADTTDRTLSPDTADPTTAADCTDAAPASGGITPLSSDLLAFLSQLPGGASPAATGTTASETVASTDAATSGTPATGAATAETLSQSASTVLADVQSFFTQLQASSGGVQTPTASLSAGSATPPPSPTGAMSGSDAGDTMTGPDGSPFGGGLNLHHLMRALESYAAAAPSAAATVSTAQGSGATA